MLKILAVLLGALGLGAALGWNTFSLPLRAGWLGFAALVGGALLARAHWSRRRQKRGDEPGWPEQLAWHALAGEAVIVGHLAGVLLLAGLAFDMHSASAHAFAMDSWTVVAGALVSYFILHDGEAGHDERDRAHAALALRAGWLALVLLLVAVILALAFGPREMLTRTSPALLAHVLIVVLVVSRLVQHGAQLHAYWRDARALQ